MTTPPNRLTSRDIARHAGVSQTTVSLVLRGAATGRVAKQTQEHVRRVARELGYLPSLSARSLRSGRTHLLGLVIPNVTDPFFGAVLRGAQQFAATRSYTVAMIESTSDDQMAEAVEAARTAHIDGIVLHSADSAQLRAARGVTDRLVAIDSGAPRGVSWIRYDIAGGVRLIMEHLGQLGHTRVAHVAGATHRATFLERKRAIARLARDKLVGTIDTPFDPVEGLAELDRALRRLSGTVTALICDNDSLAAMAYGVARGLGISIPEQLSLAAFNDTLLARALDLTTVDIPAADAGTLGVRMLLDLIDGGPRVTKTFPVTLIPRRSTSAPTRLIRLPERRPGHRRPSGTT